MKTISAFAALLLCLNYSSKVSAAPCCASASTVPSLITGDEIAQVSISATSGEVIADAPYHGIPVFRGPGTEATRTYRLNAAKVFADRWQLGLSAPVVEHFKRPGSSHSTGVGDLSISTAYEILPEWEYSPWKPRGYLFSQALLPTGRSTYQSTLADQTDVTGSGFVTWTFGAILVKKWNKFDLSLSPALQVLQGRTFQDMNGSSLAFAPTWGSSFLLSAGYSPTNSPFRGGVQFQPQYTAVRAVNTSFGYFESQFKLVWDFAVNLSYMIDDEWSLSSAYTDQTFFGPAVNSSLSRTFAMTLQKRWLR